MPSTATDAATTSRAAARTTTAVSHTANGSHASSHLISVTSQENTIPVAAPPPSETETEFILDTGAGKIIVTSSETEVTTVPETTELETIIETTTEAETQAVSTKNITGSLIMIIVIAVCAVGAGIFYYFYRKRNTVSKAQTAKTAQDLINVRDIEGNCLYTIDGNVFVYLRIDGLPIDLYTEDELMNISRNLSAQLVRTKFTWEFLTASRPMDLKPTLGLYAQLQTEADIGRKELLRLEEQELVAMADRGDTSERQHYIILWGHESKKDDVMRNADQLIKIFEENSINSELLTPQEITELLNIVNIPAYNRIENRYDFTDSLLEAIIK